MIYRRLLPFRIRWSRRTSRSAPLAALSLLVSAALLTACGSSSGTGNTATSTTQGTLAIDPPLRIASLNAQLLAAQLGANSAGAQLLLLSGTPSCGVDFYYLKFWTRGGAGETTQSSGALMVPTGPAPACSGPRPVVLYAHGTSVDKTMNIADITNTSNTEGALIAAMFAAQGFIVVAPNYAGYDSSTLGYHPFLNAEQQSGEMMDILTAARTALPHTMSAATSDGGKLFVTGYSEGGYVAMATERALLASGAMLTGAAPLSGPYALEAFGDAIFFGLVNLGSTEFAPLISTSYQKAYGNIYTAPTDLYSATYANGIETLLPSDDAGALFSSNLLPETALFDSTTPVVTVPNSTTLSTELTALLSVPGTPGYPIPPSPLTPLFAAGFGDPYLINNSYRLSYALDAAGDPDGAFPTPAAGAPLAAAAPMQPLRQALFKNDLRNGGWAPTVPTLLCGGDGDPTVLYSLNTGTIAAFWSAQVQAGLISVLDVGATPAGPFAPLQTGFQAAEQAQLQFLLSPAGGGLTQAQAQLQLIESYHTAVAPFCAAAARAFFGQL